LKQGIDDGFLAPYKVVRVGIDKDLEGWRPPAGKVDIYGNEIEDREYNIKDYDRNLIIDDRTKTVAKRISDFLRGTHRFDKTIVFCVDIDHAERMRQALVNENSDLVAENAKYVMRITGDNDEGKAQLDYFIAEESKYPVIVTTSKLMTTGVDCKTCKLIVLDNSINSMTEFKQIIGRGTRLKPEYFVGDERHTKEYFTIMDFRDACRLFADPDFDGDPIPVDDDDNGTTKKPPVVYPPHDPDGTGGDGTVNERPVKYRVNDVEVTILNERVQYYDKDGKLITESVTDYSKKNILGEYATLDEFLRTWNTSERKQAVIEELKERGVLLDALREAVGNLDIDDFDLICHIAFDKKPLTKAERAANVRKRDYLSRHEGVARDVLSALLDKYAVNGISDLEKLDVLMIDPFRKIATPQKIINAFGGKQNYVTAVRELQNQIYAAA
jgi:type I restriction enzyme R subunit